jgi:acyl carrier protein
VDPSENTKERVVQTIAGVLKLDEREVENLRKEIGYKRLKKWTSARHAEIMVAIEDDFDIEIEDRALAKLSNVRRIVDYVEGAR